MTVRLRSIPRPQRLLEIYCSNDHPVAVLRKRPGTKPATLDAVRRGGRDVRAKWAWTDEGLAGVLGNPNTDPHWQIMGAGVIDSVNYACHVCVPARTVVITASMIEAGLARYKTRVVRIVSEMQ